MELGMVTVIVMVLLSSSISSIIKKIECIGRKRTMMYWSIS